MKRFVISVVAVFAAVAMAQFTPGNVECIAPASPGGGWDFTCRVPAAQVMSTLDLVPGSIQVTNLSGGGGGIAYANVVTQREGDEDLIVAASVATATRLAQDVFAGFTADDVRWFGALGADYGTLAVDINSDIETLDDLIAAMQEDPEALTFVGGSAVGGFDHIKVLQLARAGGIQDILPFRYISFDGGATAIIEVKGGRADVFTGDISELIGELDAGTMRALAVFSPERIDRVSDVPTATELGYELIAPNWRGFYGAPGISDEAYDYWVNAVETVANSEEWATLREENGLAPFESFGANFEGFVRDQIAVMREISQELGVIE
jgi:putative tricarboxylic transport membrane protein